MASVTFRCLRSSSRATYGAGACPFDGTWEAEGRTEPRYGSALVVDAAEAVCPHCGELGTADAEKTVVVRPSPPPEAPPDG